MPKPAKLNLAYFGTDGIRGRVGSKVMDPEFILKLGWAAGTVLTKHIDNPSVIIGKDTRLSGYLLESVLEAGLTSAGVDVMMLGPVPTPAVAYLTKVFRAHTGIMISASHNPYYDNGIKFFTQQGTKIPDAWELEIEDLLHQPMKINPARLGKVTRIDDARGRYIEFCKGSVFNSSVSLLKTKIVIDCANGATYRVAPSVFQELGAEVVVIGNQPNGMNINEHCGSTHPEALTQEVIKQRADLGIALDGDGDRLIMVDHLGQVVDGDELLYVMATNSHHKPRGVVGTLMSNLGLELSLKRAKIAFTRTAVGDRYVAEMLRKRNWWLGGEPSGHLINFQISNAGDGIINALQIVKILQDTGQPLHKLKLGMTKYPQVLINVNCAHPEALKTNRRIKSLVAKESAKLASHSGRILLRPSGTEPVVRIMVEGSDANLVTQIAETLAEVVTKEL